MIAEYYFECHVTIEPVFDDRLENAKQLARNYGFKIADLLMRKRLVDKEIRSKHDTFMTGRSKVYEDLEGRMVYLIMKLQREGYKVWRYKIEDTLIDSKFEDIMGIL